MKKHILSEVSLFINNEGFEVCPLSYGNRLLSYLSDRPKKRALERLLTNEIEIVICCRATAKLLASMDCKNVKMIQLTSTGYDGVQIETFKQKGITVYNAAGVYSYSIAETVLYAILAVCKRLRKNPKNHAPKLLRKYSEISELAGKRILIMGAGNIGTEIAKRLNAFECQIDGYDPYYSHKEPYKMIVSEKTELLKKLGQYDYIISTIPATEETQNFCDKHFFAQMSSTAWFMNVGRAATVSENDLYDALKKKEIGGAIFDVVELVPFKLFNKFRRLQNTLVLPGIATSSHECLERVKLRMQENIVAFLDGDKTGSL